MRFQTLNRPALFFKYNMGDANDKKIERSPIFYLQFYSQKSEKSRTRYEMNDHNVQH